VIIAENVRSRPGGRVVLLFDEHGYATRPLNARERMRLVALWAGSAALIGLLPSLVPIWWADRIGAENPWPYFVPAALCLLVMVGLGLALAIRDYARMAVPLAVFAVMVACFPLFLLLLLPGVRRTLFPPTASQEERRWRRDQALRSTFSPPVAYTYVHRARLTRSGRRVSVELHHTNGRTVTFTAGGQSGQLLAGQVQERLGHRVHV
jgi:hypothetical protein